MSKHKVSIIGAGHVGATATYCIAEKVIADLVMVDIAGGMTEDEILQDFPELTREDIKACLAFAADRERKLFVAPA